MCTSQSGGQKGNFKNLIIIIREYSTVIESDLPPLKFFRQIYSFRDPNGRSLKKDIPFIVTFKKTAVTMKIHKYRNLEFSPNYFSRTFYAGSTTCLVLE